VSRVVMFVFNDCTTDARVLREAESLAAAGHQVTIMARPRDVTATGVERERRAGFEIVRIPLPQGWKRWWVLLRYPWRARGWVRFRLVYDLRRGPPGWGEAAAIVLVGLLALPWVIIRGSFYLLFKQLRRGAPAGGDTLDWLVRWRYSIVGWARAAAAAAPEADVYHGHDLSGLPGAIAGAARHPGSAVVYDSHEIYVESGRIARLPRWVRSLLARRERGWIATAAALVTVNESLAEDLARRYRPRRVVVIRNCPARWTPPSPRPPLLRDAAGIPPGAPIALYHGGFSAHRGMEELAEALLEPGLERVHAAYLGYGSERANLVHRAADQRYGGRLHVLDAVPPAELPPWVASADVGVMPIQRSTLNHYLSTPNKLFESLAAGVPVVVSDFPEMRRIVMEDPDGPLGATCDPADPASVARAIRSVIDLDPVLADDLRRRCLAAAHERYNWETEVSRLLSLYADLAAALEPPAQPADARRSAR
jgi:glycosyltransferase involved in cell wall biosynthesis